MASQLSGLLSDVDIRALDVRTKSTAAVATVATVAALGTAWIVRDYNEWVAFGSGGTPPTPSGYWRMTKIRWRQYWSSDDMRDASSLSNESPRYLNRDLPQREGKRPQIVPRTMPQRQKPEPLDAAIKERLHNLPAKYCKDYPQILVLDLSKTEGRSTDAIYAKPDLAGRDPSAKDKILGNEIAHVHPADNSLHVWLSGPDAKVAVEKGWGERFPLSSMGITHPSWIMVYAPRSMTEIDVIEEIIKAGIAFLTGEKI